MEIGFRDLQRMTVKLLDEKLNGSKMVIKVDGEPKYVLSGVDSQADTITGFRIGKKSLPPAFEDYYREKAKAQHLDLEDYLIKQMERGATKVESKRNSDEPELDVTGQAIPAYR